jgi:hypothetical protein
VNATFLLTPLGNTAGPQSASGNGLWWETTHREGELLPHQDQCVLPHGDERLLPQE